ncbi:MAG: hypothetical protein IBJ00_07705 [Alphaproteobacteria bacterium]|nr:hypothetical protein [Alphaproteobacteria bacterium]
MAISHSGFELYSIGKMSRDGERCLKYQLIRLLIGSLGFKRDGRKYLQTVNYSDMPPSSQLLSPRDSFKAFIADYGVSYTPGRFIAESILDNRNFYKDILVEFLNYFQQTARQSHTAAFVYLYRVLERMFYSVPLIYVSTQTDYYNTFDDLKDILKEDKIGEMGLYKKMLGQGKFIDAAELDLTYAIDFSSSSNALKFYDVTERLVNNFDSKDRAAAELVIKFRNAGDLLSSLRNRFFHTRTGDGKSNIKAENMFDSDEYFSFVNPIFCSYLAQVILSISAVKYK